MSDPVPTEAEVERATAVINMTEAEFLGLKTCRNCERADRLAVKAYRGSFHVVCDCGTRSALAHRITSLVYHWNVGIHWSPTGMR